jgi:hypothetical protein
MCSSLAAENPDDYLWDRLWVNGGNQGGVNGYTTSCPDRHRCLRPQGGYSCGCNAPEHDFILSAHASIACPWRNANYRVNIETQTVLLWEEPFLVITDYGGPATESCVFVENARQALGVGRAKAVVVNAHPIALRLTECYAASSRIVGS